LIHFFKRFNLSVSVLVRCVRTSVRNMATKKRAREEDGKDSPAKINKTATDWGHTVWDSHPGALKLSSWNVDGLRACASKGGADFLTHESPDVLCLQETKVSEKKLPSEFSDLGDYPHRYWLAAEKEGYSGVGLLSKTEPLNVEYGFQDKEAGAEHNSEGRVITAEFPTYYLVTAYVPNAGKKLVTLDKRMDWDPLFRNHVSKLDKLKPVIICGDLNVAHKEIDLKNPKTNKKNAGFTQEERDGFSELLSAGFVDSFRHFKPDEKDAYTFWTYMMGCRAKNVGWRLDYFLVSERLVPNLKESLIREKVFGSDHCPITLVLDQPE